MEEGRIAQWKKKAGDVIKPGEILASVETDKATLDWEWAGDEGFIARVLPEGDLVKVGDAIGMWVEEESEIAAAAQVDLGGSASASPVATPPPAAPAATPTPPSPPATKTLSSSELEAAIARSGPAVQNLYHSLPDVDLSSVSPTGKDGRFVKGDLLSAPKGAPKAAAASTAASSSTAATPAATPLPPAPVGQRRFVVEEIAGQRKFYVL
jgi:pyruvate dehydrogenase E2 component (dihydrolipoamide acetyltransferase)